MTQKKAVKLLVEAGIIPKNALQQLANYKLIPGDYIESHGTRPINLEQGGAAVDQFVDELGTALKDDISTVRETELDQQGEAQSAVLYWADDYGGYHKDVDVRVDKLGRVIIPATEGYGAVSQISIGEGVLHSVVRLEPRYEGDNQVAWVCYLDTSNPLEEEVHEPEPRTTDN